MSKLVNWGHWLVAAAFAAKGIYISYRFLLDLIHGKRSSIETLYSDYLIGVVGVIYLLCSWGLPNWRRWGLVVAITLSAGEIFVVALFVSSRFPLWLDRGIVLWIAITRMIVAWLLLPPVRAQYGQRTQAA
jgi:hypothetical protein